MIVYPKPHPRSALKALIALIRHKQLLAPLEVFHAELGNAFRLELPGFKAIMLSSAGANHFVLVEARDRLRWRNAGDPVTHLLKHGILAKMAKATTSCDMKWLRHCIAPCSTSMSRRCGIVPIR